MVTSLPCLMSNCFFWSTTHLWKPCLQRVLPFAFSFNEGLLNGITSAMGQLSDSKCAIYRRGPRIPALMGFLVWAAGPIVSAEGPCLPHVEEHLPWESATFRPHTDAFTTCPVSEAAYRQVVQAWLAGRRDDGGRLASISLGRAIDYPCLSLYLTTAAMARPDWSANSYRGDMGRLNQLVASLLAAPAFLPRLQVAFEGSPYRVLGVSVEKVLVRGVRNPSAGPGSSDEVLAPYDAMVWLRLGPSRE